MKYLNVILLISLFYSCNNSNKIDNTSDSKNEKSYIDSPFVQEYHDGYKIDNTIGCANDVRAIQTDKFDNIWIATKCGVYMKEPDSREWKLMISGSDQGPAYDIKSDENGVIWIAYWNGIYTNESGTIEKIDGPEPPIAKVVIAKEGIYALGPHGIWLYQNKIWEKKNYSTARSMRAAISDGEGGLWIGSDVGLYHCNSTETIVLQNEDELISAYVRGIDFSEQGDLWVGCLGGVSIRNATGKIDEKLPEDGITNAWVNVCD